MLVGKAINDMVMDSKAAESLAKGYAMGKSIWGILWENNYKEWTRANRELGIREFDLKEFAGSLRGMCRVAGRAVIPRIYTLPGHF